MPVGMRNDRSLQFKRDCAEPNLPWDAHTASLAFIYALS